MSVVFTSEPEVLVFTEDFRNFRHAMPIRVRRDDGAVMQNLGPTDACSTPCLLWPKYPPFGQYGKAADIHDGGYRNTLQRLKADADDSLLHQASALRKQALAMLEQANQIEASCWALANLNKDQCDTLFLDCMSALGVDQDTKDALYEGVHFGGWKAFRDDRA